MRGTRSFEDLIADPDLDAVAIATPVSTHYPLALAALHAGKHVFIEKPLAASVAQAEELAALAAARGLTLMPGHTFLYSPPVNIIRDLITSGELGDIYFISMSRVNLGLHQSDVSVAWDLGPHDFSILRYWLEVTPSHVAATSRSCIFPTSPTSRSSTSSTSRVPSHTSSSRGSRRASCGERRSSAHGRWSSTTTSATSRCASSTRA